jgi:phospholipid N-methyltransferase
MDMAMNKVASKLRALADRMQERIDDKRNPACGQQNWTARRADMAGRMIRDAERMEKIQMLLYALADLHERGIDESHPLFRLRTKKAVGLLLDRDKWPHWENEQKTCVRVGLTPDSFIEARAALLALVEFKDYAAERKRRELENEARRLVGTIPGFFPTPPEIALDMISLANLQKGCRVLEPSAGSGAIADLIVEHYPGCSLEVAEINHTLARLLEAKGHRVIGSDFFSISGEWDRILMNPPFENLQDTEHIKHAFDCLAENGVLVAICSESPMFRQDKKAVAFREWLEGLDHSVNSLPHGAFAKSGTGVKANILTVYR